MALADKGIKFLRRWATSPEEEAVLPVQPFHEIMRYRKAYYDTKDLYERIRFGLEASGATSENIDNVRSPVFRAVEFHVGHVMPGTLPGALKVKGDSALNQKGRDQLDKLFRFSNFSSRKQSYVRTAAWSGQAFLKVAQAKADRYPFLQVLKPQFVREIEVDERGHLTYFRSSIPEKRGRGSSAKVVWVTEVHSKEDQAIFRYEDDHPLDEVDKDKAAKITRLAALGIDFVPVVWAPFMETEPGRGESLFGPFIDKVDNVNRAATRLHDMLFRYNRSVWALERTNLTPEGYEMPPVELEGSFADAYTNLSDEEYEDMRGYPRSQRHADGTKTLGEDPMTSLPSGATLRSLVPTVDYSSALQIVNADMDDLAQDMPELLYTKALESAARDSSKVLEIQLAGAIDRAREARGNLETGVIRAYQMAVTIGQKARLAEYSALGQYEKGDLDFEFEARPVVPPDPAEEAEEVVKKAEALTEKIAVLKAMNLSTEVLMDEVAKLVGVEKGQLVEAAGRGEGEADGDIGEAESALQSLLSGAVGAGNGNGSDAGRGAGNGPDAPAESR